MSAFGLTFALTAMAIIERRRKAMVDRVAYTTDEAAYALGVDLTTMEDLVATGTVRV